MKGRLIKVTKEKMNVTSREEHYGEKAGHDKGRNDELVKQVEAVINRKKKGAVFVMVDTGSSPDQQDYACYMTANEVNPGRFREAFETSLPNRGIRTGGVRTEEFRKSAGI